MEKDEYTRVVHLKKLIENQLIHSKDLNLEYKLSKDFLMNYREQRYTDFVCNRTGKDKEELKVIASKLICSVNKYIFKSLSEMTDKELTDISNEPSKMDKFIKKLNKFINDNISISIFSLKSVG